MDLLHHGRWRRGWPLRSRVIAVSFTYITIFLGTKLYKLTVARTFESFCLLIPIFDVAKAFDVNNNINNKIRDSLILVLHILKNYRPIGKHKTADQRLRHTTRINFIPRSKATTYNPIMYRVSKNLVRPSVTTCTNRMGK